MTRIFPMLDDRYAEGLIVSSFNKSLEALAETVSASHPKTKRSDSPGREVSEGELWDIRSAVLHVAREHGYPERDGARLIDFDKAAAPVLLERVDAPTADARSGELWNFLTCSLLLDVANWRFDNPAQRRRFERYLGKSPKNVFSRLWWRAYILRDLSGAIDEDQSVALMERTGLSGDWRAAQHLVEVFNNQLDFMGREGVAPSDGKMKMFRRFAAEVLAMSAVTCFGALGEAQLRERFEQVAKHVMEARTAS